MAIDCVVTGMVVLHVQGRLLRDTSTDRAIFTLTEMGGLIERIRRATKPWASFERTIYHTTPNNAGPSHG